MIYSPQNIKHKCCTWACKTGLLDSLSLEACWVNCWYCGLDKTRGEVKDKDKDKQPFNYSFYRTWTVLNWFVEVFSIKTQRHKRHWVCCCTDLWWGDLYRSYVWAERLCHVHYIYVSNILWQLVLCHNHKQTHQSLKICHKDTCAFNCSSSAEEKACFFTLICVNNKKHKRISVIWWKLQRDFKLIGKLKLKQKKRIPCRSVL